MTISYFKKLFDYDFWANERMLAAMEGTSDLNEEAIKKMNHLLMAKALWLSRLIPGMPTPDLAALLTSVERRSVNAELKVKMEGYFYILTDGHLAGKIAYKNTKGIPFEFILSDILAHLANHATYHRGQIASLIKRSGGTPPETDYIAYVRDEKA